MSGKWGAMFAIAMAGVMQLLDVSVVNIALPDIERDLGANFNELRFEDKKGEEQIYFHAEKDFERFVENDDELTVDEGDQTITIKKGDRMLTLDLGAATTEAMKSIELKVGANSIKIDQTGVTIKGTMIKIEGTAKADLKAPLTTIQADGKLTAKGGVTMIN